MLVLTRKTGEGISLGDDIHVKVLRVSGSRVTLGIEAPQGVRVLRSDLLPVAGPVAGDASTEEPPLAPLPR